MNGPTCHTFQQQSTVPHYQIRAAYNAYEYTTALNPNIANTSAYRGTYEAASGSTGYVTSPSARVTFNHPGGTAVTTSK